MMLLFEVVEKKMNRDNEADLSVRLKEEINKENKYHLVQNYNNDMIRRSLKSQNNNKRINIKEKPHNNLLQNHIMTLLNGKDKHREAGNSFLYNHTPTGNMSFSTNNKPIVVATTGKKMDRLEGEAARSVKEGHSPNMNSKIADDASIGNGSMNKRNLAVKNTLIERLKKRNTSKMSNRSEEESIDGKKRGNNNRGGEVLMMVGKNKPTIKDDTSDRRNAGKEVLKKEVHHAHGNLANHPINHGNLANHGELRKEQHTFKQPLLNVLHNKNILTLTQNLLNKRNKC